MYENAVAVLLQPWVGTQLLAQTDLSADTAALLQGFDCINGDIAALAHALSKLIFDSLRRHTGGDMRVRLDDGRTMRVRVDDVDQMADEVLYLVLHRLAHNVRQCHRLRAFAMTHNSLSALRALYVDFAAFQTPDERALLADIARSGHPAYRWRQWLDEETRNSIG